METKKQQAKKEIERQRDRERIIEENLSFLILWRFSFDYSFTLHTSIEIQACLIFRIIFYI